MRPRRNSDEAFRRLLRKVVEGDLSEIPALARAYERQGGAPLSDAVLRDVVAAFENLERAADSLDGPADILLLFTDMDDYPECDENGAANADVGYLRGVAEASGMTHEELWALSETRRQGAGAMRRVEREERADNSLPCSRCGMVMPTEDLTNVQSDPENPMTTEPVCASCWDIMHEAGDIIGPPPTRRAAQADRAARSVLTCDRCGVVVDEERDLTAVSYTPEQASDRGVDAEELCGRCYRLFQSPLDHEHWPN